jgi:hypothetical protein
MFSEHLPASTTMRRLRIVFLPSPHPAPIQLNEVQVLRAPPQ